MQAWLNADQKRILRWSIARQLAMLALMAATTCLIAPFDDSGRLLLAGSSRSSILAHIALPFTQWDTLHFLGIARDGYATEQQFAFMPGVPLLLRFFGRGLASSRGFDAAAAVVGTSLLANVLSVCLPVMLYSLSTSLFGMQHRRVALSSALIYCLYPAPSVLAVPYTEPFYAFFTFAGMILVSRSYTVLAVAALACATAFRSNGVLNSGFLIWHLLWQRPVQAKFKLVVISLAAAGCVLVIASPFLAQQAYAYRTFCKEASGRPWCAHRLPLVYTFAQEQYWNVGFLRYFRPEQIPNFALALPVLSLYFSASWTYYSANWPAWVWRTFRLSAADSQNHKLRHAFLHDANLPHVHLHTLLALQLLFFSHVQIALRQAVTNPVLFWFLAYLYESRPGGSTTVRQTVRWSMLWAIASVTLWTAFYPPA